MVTDSLKAQSIVAFRQLKLRERAMSHTSKIKLEDLSKAIADGQIQELPLVVKADVQGSVEALSDQLMKIPQQKIKLRIIRSGAGAISEGDVLLAAASNAVVIGFNVRPERKAADAAERDKVDIRLYTVIYDAVDEMKKAMEGLLEPSIREVRLGAATVQEAFRISKVGTIAGCLVTDGKVNRNAQVRLLRDNVVIHTGKVVSLKRFKDDATEVKAGLECGIGIANYNDIKPGDVIEFFTTEKVKETLAVMRVLAGDRPPVRRRSRRDRPLAAAGSPPPRPPPPREPATRVWDGELRLGRRRRPRCPRACAWRSCPAIPRSPGPSSRG